MKRTSQSSAGALPGYLRPVPQVAKAMDKDPQGFQVAVDAWRQKWQQMADRDFEIRPDHGPEIDQGRLSTAPNPVHKDA
jgi:hypothetical protein